MGRSRTSVSKEIKSCNIRVKLLDRKTFFKFPFPGYSYLWHLLHGNCVTVHNTEASAALCQTVSLLRYRSMSNFCLALLKTIGNFCAMPGSWRSVIAEKRLQISGKRLIHSSLNPSTKPTLESLAHKSKTARSCSSDAIKLHYGHLVQLS